LRSWFSWFTRFGPGLSFTSSLAPTGRGSLVVSAGLVGLAGLVVAGPVGLGILWILHEIKLNGFEIIGLLHSTVNGAI